MRNSSLCALCLLAVPVAAQVPSDTGPLAGTHVALSELSTSGLDAIRIKTAGFQTSLPVARNLPPDFRSSSLFAARFNCPAPAGPINIDAISIGADLIEANSLGEVDAFPRAGFYAMLFSVPSTTWGAAGTPVGLERATGQFGASADVFSYIFPGSPWAAPGVERVLDSTEIQLGPPAIPSPEIDALDWYIPLYDVPGLLAALPLEPWLYFSVDFATKDNIPDAWVGGFTMFKSGATIFRTRWSAATSSWSCPEIAIEPGQLNLLTSDDIDALAVDTVLHQPETYVLFSTTSGQPDPIRFAWFSATSSIATVSTFRFRNIAPHFGAPVSSVLGLGGGDIDALSLVDPEWAGTGGPATFCNGNSSQSRGFGCWNNPVGEGRAAGGPRASLGIFPQGTAHSAAWRHRLGNGDGITSFLVSQSNGPVFMLIEAPAGSFNFVLATQVGRTSFAGTPAVWTTPVPPGVPYGALINFHWYEILSATQAQLPLPLQFRL
jgi:hypothetical protein